MKNKLAKTNKYRFDYKARKLGIIGLFIIVASLCIMAPIASSLSSMNKNLKNEITLIQNEKTNDDAHQTHVERK